MKLRLQWLCGILCALLLLGIGTSALAAETSPIAEMSHITQPGIWQQATSTSQQADESDVGFYVKAQLPDNQVAEVPFFDLRMQPQQQQTLEVLVGNRNASPLRVKVAAVCATTNRMGVIDYKNDADHDETLPCRFCEMATVHNEVLEVPGGGTATAKVDIQMPAQAYEGSVMGSIVVEKIPQEEWEDASSQASSSSNTQPGIYLRHRYNYAIAVRLWEGENTPQHNFVLKSVQADKIDGRPVIVHAIQNPVAAVANSMEGDFIIHRTGEEEPVAELLNTPIEMANNSTMEYCVAPGNNHLPAGHYTSQVQLRHKGQVWNFTAEFDITGEQARAINVLEPEEAQNGIPTWLIVTLILLALAVIGLVVVLVAMRRRHANPRRAVHRAQHIQDDSSQPK